MSSDADHFQLMAALQPARPITPCPAPPDVVGPSAAWSDKYKFSTAGLLRALESRGYETVSQPANMLVTLYDFQQQTLKWMLDRERMPGGLNRLFWQEHPLKSSQSFFYNPTCGEFMRNHGDDGLCNTRPASGGFLCEEMGLGKWADIKRAPEFEEIFDLRSAVDLKDKWRNLTRLAKLPVAKLEEKVAKELSRTGESIPLESYMQILRLAGIS